MAVLLHRVAALDSGKPMVDAAFGEVMVTCEKAVWLLQQGERWLRPERRSAGRMVSHLLCTRTHTKSDAALQLDLQIKECFLHNMCALTFPHCVWLLPA